MRDPRSDAYIDWVLSIRRVRYLTLKDETETEVKKMSFAWRFGVCTKNGFDGVMAPLWYYFHNKSWLNGLDILCFI